MTSLRRLLALFILVVAFSATLVPAGAVQVDDIIDQVFAQGFYLESGTSITAAEAAALVSSARNEGARYHLVVLVETLPGGNIVFAEVVYDLMGIDSGTVLALSEDETGWVSVAEFTEAELESAFVVPTTPAGLTPPMPPISQGRSSALIST